MPKSKLSTINEIVEKCYFGTIVGWVNGFDLLFETHYLSAITYGER